ncbi:MAG: asparagine synthase (glutamine-hydrolyzing), partial [Phycisphaerae bacterium]
AFALYDAREGALLLARDRLGQKPLWYAPLADRIVFASEASALLAHPDVTPEPDIGCTALYMCMGYVPGPRSAWRGVLKLPPATYSLSIDRLGMPESYWRIPEDDQPAPPDVEARTAELLRETVGSRLVSDVPLGTLLSGGLDSAIVTALACEAAGDAAAVRTFTAGFDDPRYDERPLAALTARRLGTRHTELQVESPKADTIWALVDRYTEPFADSSAVPTFQVCQAAREHVTVALAGDGGDEVFGGYDRYRAMHLAQHLRPWEYAGLLLVATVIGPFAGQDERSRLRRIVRFAGGLPHPPSLQYFIYRSMLSAQQLAELFEPDFLDSLAGPSPLEWFADLYESADRVDEACQAQTMDLRTYLPDDLLVKADIASMASSLELRAPLLDHRIVEWGLQLPAKWKVGRGGGKRILRSLFADKLPAEVLAAPKRGFGVPLAAWLCGPVAETLQGVLLDEAFLNRGIFNPLAVRSMVATHLNGRRDHSHRLWALLVFARWLSGRAFAARTGGRF